jgi:8-oxo-dGTP diphosphatase
MATQYVMMTSAAIFDGEKMLIVRRSNNEPYLSAYWTGIGGKLEDGETVEEGVLREAFEETGLRVVPIVPIYVEEFTREDRPGMKAVNIIYWCTVIDDLNDIKLSDEHDAHKWITKGELENCEMMTNLAKSSLSKIFDIYTRLQK